MLISRRTFIAVTGLGPLAPLLATVRTVLTMTENAPLIRLPELAPQASEASDVVLKIDGWSACDEASSEVWLAVGQSWRTAWR